MTAADETSPRPRAPQDPTPRANVLGVGVHGVNMDTAVESLASLVERGGKGWVGVTGVHGVMVAQEDEEFRQLLNRAYLNVPDGMPMTWVGRAQQLDGMDRVFGPDLMDEICRQSVVRGWTHFFYGGNDGVAEQLRDAMTARHPGLDVVGTFTPPFRPLEEAELTALRAQVSAARPDFFWVGLSTPKQERFMEDHLNLLDTSVMLGVGAAFDLHTGSISDAPAWVKRAGMQWLHRLLQEPGRLWKRYLINNPKFIAGILLQTLGIRRHRL